jgi:hypothetical protein
MNAFLCLSECAQTQNGNSHRQDVWLGYKHIYWLPQLQLVRIHKRHKYFMNVQLPSEVQRRTAG